ncbi:formate/nitrite transporter family protein [Lutispora thermophila]|uniref:Formate/nitrite transporter n=1 Tax=Lutispora thermophila DSM 19022 TaxID=1122184 RepID=A0A1M6AVH7_9FIRM|nr:formate/nitrite transporter family protein [Lutispora thermophila]SHI40328.1 formate/nitrite transporter [Lutispora thermophila DSM 19022]
MEKRLLTPKEIAQATIDAGVAKTKLSIMQMAILGIFAGMFIGFGATGAITIGQTYANIDVGLSKFLFAAVFPVGLMLVVICGAELFTGNNLMILGCLNGNYKLKDVLKNWAVVYIANFVGSVLLAFLVAKSSVMAGAAAEKAIGIANAKVAIPFGAAIIRGILCNILVVLAVWMATGSRDIISKIFACWFPIMLFVLIGFEHSIANMYFIPLGKFLGAPVTWGQIWVNNLIPVTIGNIIGGAVIVPFAYYTVYVKTPKTSTKVENNAKMV